jgi:hypothetical protein
MIIQTDDSGESFLKNVGLKRTIRPYAEYDDEI